MKSRTTTLIRTLPFAILTDAVGMVPERVYGYLVENSMGPAPEHSIAFTLSFIGLLVATGFSVKRLHHLRHSADRHA